MAKPAPKGAPILPVTASGPGKTTSPVTPSADSSSSRFLASQPPRSPSSCRLLPSSSSPNHSSWNSSLPGEHVVVGAEALAAHLLHERVAFGELVVEAVAVLRVEVLAVHRRVGPRVAVGRDDEVALRHCVSPGAPG